MPFRIQCIAVFAVLCSEIQFAVAILNDCYDSSGVQNFKIFPCQPTAEQTACCSAGDICYSNGLCAPGPTENTGITPFFLDGCTDPSFSGPSCVNDCLAISGNGIQVCSGLGANHFCCYGFGGCNCSDPSAVFTLAAATVVTTISPSTSFIASTSTSSSSSSIATTSSTISSSLSSSANAATVSVSPSSSTTPAASSASSSSNGVAIGVGVGVGIPAAVAIAGLLVFFLRKRKTSKATELPAQQIPLHPPMQDYYGGPKPPGVGVGVGGQGYTPQGFVPKPYGQVNELSSDAHYYQPPGELPGHY